MPITVEEFEAARPHLLSAAHRMLGSAHDAQDAVQTAWLRAMSARSSPSIENPSAWLTTVIARVCLDELRARRRRNEAPLLAGAVPAAELAADEAVLRTEDVSRALMVLLNQLTPPQRVAYVLHDLFSVPFDQIADVLGGTVPSAKKHASRARQRLDSAQDASAQHSRPDQPIVEAFLTAARTGDTRRMIQLLASDSVRDADAALLPRGARTAVIGAVDIATETVQFRDRIQAACRLTVNSEPVYLIAPGGHPLATIDISTAKQKVTRITLRLARADDRFAAAPPPTAAS
ncbi:ECF RNA polymerase sigma factor SigJ [Streptomyces sp. ADI92-24]|uniref:sigma-70 family RNA polymerase sigma factor n=1 Tax=unclassified Streptomyces TaxID=2593676 RepID=UPI000F46E551|nr:MULTISPECIES: sigma-70 family RNA polymerase sigma factor [unclassified Streptomyces]MCX4772455.1 sigma-70 family RNA polymerase sigma factor [Streptomyces sp. NBC_01285]ROQ71574.1 RNA polymerase sigma-70 factor (ECF subfamily) [Streptomyces sp. CEV 2-1]RPK50829.1 ECF RNA polymerase sigma factor SigJ [Streptomyces sp. ADI92-24]